MYGEDRVYKKIELIGTSKKSIEDAIQAAVGRAHQTLEKLSWFEVGEIRDEYDVESEPVVDEGEGRFLFSGKVDIDEVTSRLGVEIERDGFETLGGYLLTHLGRVPTAGEQVAIGDLHVEVVDVDRRRIGKVRLTRREDVKTVEGERTT